MTRLFLVTLTLFVITAFRGAEPEVTRTFEALPLTGPGVPENYYEELGDSAPDEAIELGGTR